VQPFRYMAKAQESDHDKSGLLTRVHVNVDLSLATAEESAKSRLVGLADMFGMGRSVVVDILLRFREERVHE